MAFGCSNSCSLGNGLEEIQFFSKEIDYDKELYESHFLEKEYTENDGSRYLCPGKPIKHKDLIKVWEEGGPVKVLPLPDFDAYPLYFKNFQELDYYQLKELLGDFFTLCEFENLRVRVTFKTEDQLRLAYQALKKDKRYNLQLFVDVGDYIQKQKDYFKKNDPKPSKNYSGQRLINKWINNGDVVIETSKYNCYPIQIKNYKQFNHDELVKLFTKYGKFTSIAQSENEYVQVKFCTEEAARKCIMDLIKDQRYNVRLLFFLKELNTQKKLVKDIVSSKADAHVEELMNAEDRIKFTPNQVPVKRHPSRLNRNNKKQGQQMNESIDMDTNTIYFKENFENGNIYIKGTPLENPFLTPPYSYKVWKNKQNHLPAPPLEDFNSISNVNYEYYVKNMKDLSIHSDSSCYHGAQEKKNF